MSIKKYEIIPKSLGHGKWYQSVLTVSDMIDYSDVSGCYVLKPWSYQIWELIKSNLDKSIQSIDVENCYFPLFVTKSNLEKESSHFDDFIPEVAWIQTIDPIVETESKKDPEINKLIQQLKSKGLNVHIYSDKSERYAIRPTSETIIYPHFSDWMKKSGKYPKINQWANVVRWENKATQPFIRSREFLWQEGHTCHPNETVAVNEVMIVLNIYKELYEQFLAVPMIDGIKTKSETFPGAELTTTIEGFLPDSGKGIQAATSHYLGTKFSTIFNIKNSDGQYVHQNSWGLTTRSIGIMVMTHSDDRGLVLPPKVAPIQVVIIACGLNSKTTPEDEQKVNILLKKLCVDLNNDGIRTVYDDQTNETPGMKFNKWETKGVPLRIEFGPKDMENGTVFFVRRDKLQKTKELFKFSETCSTSFIKNFLNKIQSDMLESAKQKIKSNIVYCKDEESMLNALKQKKLTLIDWQQTDGFENNLKNICKTHNISSTKVLCLPNKNTLHEYGFDTESTLALFGRSY